jgi:hypothetical protein
MVGFQAMLKPLHPIGELQSSWICGLNRFRHGAFLLNVRFGWWCGAEFCRLLFYLFRALLVKHSYQNGIGHWWNPGDAPISSVRFGTIQIFRSGPVVRNTICCDGGIHPVNITATDESRIVFGYVYWRRI